MYLFWLYNVCLSETREIGTKCTDGRNKTRPSRRIDENDIMFLCTPQVVGKPSNLPIVKHFYHALRIGILDKYELYIQKQEIISIDGIHIKLPMPS
jgi:hypothetical protein